MSIKLILSILLILIIIGYIIGFIGDPYIFSIFFLIAFLFGFLLFILFIFKITKNKKKYKIWAFCISFFIICVCTINHYLGNNIFNPANLVFDTGIAIFTIFLSSILLKPKKNKKVLLISTISFVLFIPIVISLNSKPNIYSKKSSPEAIKSLPYLAYVVEDKAEHSNEVVKYDKTLCYQGINIYNSYFKPGAHLLDMSGNILHTWLPEKSHSNWHYVKIYNDDNLLVCIANIALMRLNWDSQIIWGKNIRTHHDIDIADNNDIYTITNEDKLVFIYCIPVPIVNNKIVILSPDGRIKKEVSLFKILKKEITFYDIFKIYWETIKPKYMLKKIKKPKKTNRPFNLCWDIFHNNTISIIKREIKELCKKDDILISVKHLNLIGIIDMKREKLIWKYGPRELEEQHHSTLLENGNILIFDNGTNRKYSRIIELEPLTNKIIWQYKEDSPPSFYSSWGGAAQRLPNGNTLITETSTGRVFEITKDREIVWEFYNPNRDENGKRATIYRMMRINDLENHPKLRELIDSDSKYEVH